MIRKWLWTIRGYLYFLASAIAVAVLVYVVMNYPAITKRLFSVRHESVLDQVEASGSVGLSDGMVWNEVSFPDIFLSSEVKQWQSDYFGKYQDNYLVIPVLGIETPIVWLDSTEESALQEKLKEGVVHYAGTANPGEKGNSFIFGHSSYYWWDWSPYASVFANLEQIKIGDKILVYYKQDLVIYEVKETKVVDPTDLSVLKQGNKNQITLMTCTPLGTSLQRFIVVAEQIN